MQRVTRLLGALAAVPLILVPVAAAGADNTWESLRNDQGDRIRWHSCTVTYTMDFGTYSPIERRAISVAINDTEDASGVEFLRVPSEQADLKIILSDKRDDDAVASTEPWLLGAEHTEAELTVYPGTFEYGYDTQVDIYRHEFGHALGLTHVLGTDTMSSTVTTNPTQDGWRTGLGWLYQHCQ